MREPDVDDYARKLNGNAATDWRLWATLEMRTILRQTRERIAKSRLMLSENYDTICEWWWFTELSRIPVVHAKEDMPTDSRTV
jgi:hypothetical protein